jgi:hypothetical protein
VELVRAGASTPSLVIKIDRETVREVTWIFGDAQDGDEEVLVGFFGARDAENGDYEGLEVRVDEWKLSGI